VLNYGHYKISRDILFLYQKNINLIKAKYYIEVLNMSTITLAVPSDLENQKKIHVDLHLECIEDPETGLKCELKEVKTTIAKDEKKEE
jgi:hypothetical protein